MDTIAVIDGFSALAQETRLAVFQLLVRHAPNGPPAGSVAGLLDVPHNTMSAHPAVLVRAHLLVFRREGRSIIYRTNLSQSQETVRFLVCDCCNGRPEEDSEVITRAKKT